MQNIIVKVPNAARKPTNVYQVCTGSIGGFKNLVTLHDDCLLYTSDAADE